MRKNSRPLPMPLLPLLPLPLPPRLPAHRAKVALPLLEQPLVLRLAQRLLARRSEVAALVEHDSGKRVFVFRKMLTRDDADAAPGWTWKSGSALRGEPAQHWLHGG
jgi:hypothetical protein